MRYEFNIESQYRFCISIMKHLYHLFFSLYNYRKNPIMFNKNYIYEKNNFAKESKNLDRS